MIVQPRGRFEQRGHDQGVTAAIFSEPNRLGFNTEVVDGVLGPQSRAMIAAWQRSTSVPGSGYLTRDQHKALLSLAADAVTKWEADQKRGMGDTTKP